MDRLQRRRRRHEELTGSGGGTGMEAAGCRRGRFDGGVPVVEQAECTAQTCRSCVALTLADVVALGCCPCAVVSLLGLAFVKAPLAVARRCLRRLRHRRGELRHKKRVRDDDAGHAAASAAKPRRALEAAHDDADGAAGAASKCARASDSSSSSSASGRLDAEKVWMEMYRVGHWGFGRLSISVAPPAPPPAPRPGCVAAGRSPDDGGGGRRKDVDLRCES